MKDLNRWLVLYVDFCMNIIILNIIILNEYNNEYNNNIYSYLWIVILDIKYLNFIYSYILRSKIECFANLLKERLIIDFK